MIEYFRLNIQSFEDKVAGQSLSAAVCFDHTVAGQH